jgi:hypothetical protein
MKLSANRLVYLAIAALLAGTAMAKELPAPPSAELLEFLGESEISGANGVAPLPAEDADQSTKAGAQHAPPQPAIDTDTIEARDGSDE